LALAAMRANTWRLLPRVMVLGQSLLGLLNLLLLVPVGMRLIHLAMADETWLALVFFSEA